MDKEQLAESLMETGNFWFPEAASALAPRVDVLFDFIYWASLILFVGILGVVFYFLRRYRATPERQKATKQVDHNTVLEITWSVIPFILVLVIFYWGYRDYLAMSIPTDDALEIRVTGYKWGWNFEYPSLGIKTSQEFFVPVDRSVKLIMSSQDVIHSFYLPNFRIKRDVLPSSYSRLWFQANRTGIFQAFCTEYCGDRHSFMLANLHVMSRDGFDQWVATRQAEDISSIPLPELGERLYKEQGCNQCHSIDGSDGIGPTWKGAWGTDRNLTDGQIVKIDDNYIRESIVNPKAKIAVGYAPVMPVYRLDDRELDGLIEYIKTLE